MSVDLPADDGGPSDDVTGCECATFPQPRAHGAAVCETLADFDPSLRDRPAGERGTLYARALNYWREQVKEPDREPYVAVEDFEAGWLPDGDHALVVKSSGWKAGQGVGDDFTQYYQQHIMLREWRRTDDGERVLSKPSTALHVEIMPQYRDMNYPDGERLECPYGEGTRLVAWTTWADSPEEIERRMYQALRAVYGRDALDLADRVPESRRLPKVEAHVRFDVDKKGAVVETVEQTKQLIAWGGESEIDARQRRQKQGWLEAVVESDRWHMLGFDEQPFSTELKVYQIQDWHQRPRSDPFAHPKLEASYAGVDCGELPHVDEWSEVMDYLRGVVATHCHWAGVDREDLVADDYFDGPGAPSWSYERPTGRRQMLRRRYEDLATELYREALKESTTAVYDILRVVAEETGATYDQLVERTGLARSTVRYHVARLAESGVVKRLGNPVLVVFVSRAVLERAREIVREVRPEDMPEDVEERAQERRERREERQEREDDQTGGADGDGQEGGEAGSEAESIGFEYLRSLSASIEDVAREVDRGQLGERDVRVRVDELPPPLR